MDLLLIGVIAKAHGLRGDVVVVPHHADSPLWKPGTAVALIAPERVSAGARDRVSVEPSRTAIVARARKNPDGRLTVGFEAPQTGALGPLGAIDRNVAEGLRGYHIGVDPALLPAATDDEIYHHEVPGWTVVDVSGRELGTALGMFAGPGGDLLEVQPPGDAETFFVPFVGAIVTRIERAARRIVIDPPEGLIE